MISLIAASDTLWQLPQKAAATKANPRALSLLAPAKWQHPALPLLCGAGRASATPQYPHSPCIPSQPCWSSRHPSPAPSPSLGEADSPGTLPAAQARLRSHMLEIERKRVGFILFWEVEMGGGRGTGRLLSSQGL